MKERTKEELNVLAIELTRYPDEIKNRIAKELIDQLIAEMEKPRRPTIDWESRPWATEVRIAYASDHMAGNQIGDRIETIKRPIIKTRAREIAEEAVKEWNQPDGVSLETRIEAAILRREKELEEGR